MSKEKIWLAAGAAVLAVGSYAVGHVRGSYFTRKAYEPALKENKKLREEIDQLLSFMESQVHHYEDLVTEIYSKKPKNKEELFQILIAYELSEQEMARVDELLSRKNFYQQDGQSYA